MTKHGQIGTTLFFGDADETEAFGAWIAPQLCAGDILLLDGPIGAGKSHLARSVIRTLLARDGLAEDIPSPSFTLVQTYPARIGIVHADLYRLGSAEDVQETGLTETFDTAITLIEWPAHIADLVPDRVLTLRLRPDPSGHGRIVGLSSPDARWDGPVRAAMARWGQS
jgi:tRNA threonylcarbamoyl adenosine modification protein YjeE